MANTSMDIFNNSVDKCIYLANNKQSELAAALGVSQQTISKCKQNQYFSPNHFERLCELFPGKITQEELFRDFNKMKVEVSRKNKCVEAIK